LSVGIWGRFPTPNLGSEIDTEKPEMRAPSRQHVYSTFQRPRTTNQPRTDARNGLANMQTTTTTTTTTATATTTTTTTTTGSVSYNMRMYADKYKQPVTVG
jgi:hypothetical protein